MLSSVALAALMTVAHAQKFPQEFSAPRRPAVETIATTNHPDRLYRLGEEATVTLTALRHGLPLVATVNYRVGNEMLLPDSWQQATLRDGKVTLPLGTMQEPGFRAVEWRFSVDGKTYKDLLKVGFEPDNIRTCAQMPKDFKTFWDKAVAEARRVPLEPEAWPAPEWSNDSLETRLLRLHVGERKWMYAYLTRPKDGRRHPVVLCLPGAGSNKVQPADYFPLQGYIYMKVEIHGNDPRLPDDEYEAMRRKNSDGYTLRGIEHRDTYYYKDVYAGVVRCMDYLCTLPDWDGRNAIVTGGSQGGALTVVAAALNDKVTALAAFYPALNDLTAFRQQRAGGWPKFFTQLTRDGNLRGHDPEKAAQVLPYYDVTNFARLVRVPGFYSYGYNDDTCSPTSVAGMVNEVTAPKVVDVTPSSGHWRFAESQRRADEWMKRQLLDAE